MAEPLLVRACRREPVERTPVWFMRQAGCSLPEYREIRRRYDLFDVCRRPELCAEVTLQPVRAHGVDAAVMFADVIQLFDSWVGALSVDDYREFVAPYSSRILASLDDIPTIHFGTGTAHLLADLAAAGGDVIGLDWRIPIDDGWAIVGPERGVQGNLDPALLLGPWERVEAAALRILEAVRGRRGHVFNLGHGVLPATDPADLRKLAELVHERTAVEVAA